MAPRKLTAMFVLAVDTSTPQVTAGIVRVSGPGGAGGGADAAPAVAELSARGHVDARAHNEVLTPLILEALDEAGVARADVSAVVVGCGPGPFTGLRVGMATAASFADAWSVPSHGVCSLDALARPGGSATPGDVLAVTDARRREVYAAAYRDGARVWGPAVMKAAGVADEVRAAVPDFEFGRFAGDAAKCADVAAGAGGDAAGAPEPVVDAAYPTPAGLVAAAIATLAEETGSADAAADSADSAHPADATALLSRDAEPLVALYLRRPDATPPKDKPRSPAIPEVPEAREMPETAVGKRHEGAGEAGERA